MAHTIDVPLSAEQLTKIRKLLKKHKTLCQRESSKITMEHTEDMEQKRLQSMERERMNIFRRVNRTSCISAEGKTAGGQCLDTNISADGECHSNSDTEKAQSSSPLHGTVQSTKISPNHNPENPFENSSSDKSKMHTENYGAQWDVFRRQDVPKLLEYLKRHSEELSYTHEYHEKVSSKEDNS